MNKKTLQISLIFLIMLLTTTSIPTKAEDKVTITIKMSGDAYVRITNTNGSVTFVYNGRNILKEYKWTVDRVNSNKLAIMLLKRDLKRLVYALNETFADLYGKVYFLAHVTGIYNGNDNSTVTLMLKSGNTTLVDFIDQLINMTNTQKIQIEELQLKVYSNHEETKQKLNQAFKEIYTNRAYYEEQLKKINTNLSELNDRLDKMKEQTNEKIKDLTNQIEILRQFANANAQSTRIAIVCLGIINLLTVILLIWIARWKAEKIQKA